VLCSPLNRFNFIHSPTQQNVWWKINLRQGRLA
jgi:hypothetical protein